MTGPTALTHWGGFAEFVNAPAVRTIVVPATMDLETAGAFTLAYGTAYHAWFYVMELVEGRIFWDAQLPLISPDDRPAYFDEMNSTIARLHAVDPAAVGLSDFGHPADYFQRQIARWSKQYRQETVTGRDSNMDCLIEWLPTRVPPGEDARIVHGDFRIDNMIFHPRRTGRECLADYPFYMAFNFFRMAAILHGIKARVIRGTASSTHTRERGESYPELARIGARWAGLL